MYITSSKCLSRLVKAFYKIAPAPIEPARVFPAAAPGTLNIGKPGLLPAPKLTNLYRTPSMSTFSSSANLSKAAMEPYLTHFFWKVVSNKSSNIKNELTNLCEN